MNVSKADQAVRRTALLHALIAGHTAAQIRAQLSISEKTLSRDLKVINDQLQQWAAEQQNRALATAIAQYQRVVDQAWADHAADAENERKWLAGEFAEQTQVADPVDGARVEKRTQQQFKSQKSDYLRVIVQATEKLCKLAGLERAEPVQNSMILMQIVREEAPLALEATLHEHPPTLVIERDPAAAAPRLPPAAEAG
jgi:DNA-binding transcriptional regulator YiaG